MAYPERGAGYKNRPAWLDRAVEGEKRAEGGGVEFSAPGTKPTDLTITPEEVKTWGSTDNARAAARARERAANNPVGASEYDEMQKQMASPRKRADGGMTNAKLAQVAPEFEPAAAQDAREAAATRVRRGADRPKTMNSPMKRMAAVSDPEL